MSKAITKAMMGILAVMSSVHDVDIELMDRIEKEAVEEDVKHKGVQPKRREKRVEGVRLQDERVAPKKQSTTLKRILARKMRK